LLKPISEETAKYGKITIRRIYGDWTSSHMNSWKDLLNEVSFTPIQKFSYTTGKNSTDSALIIDAMDIYSGVYPFYKATLSTSPKNVVFSASFLLDFRNGGLILNVAGRRREFRDILQRKAVNQVRQRFF
jgi:hypothetical protein